MIVCPRCSKENQDHYMFCLGCGTDLKGGGGPKKEFKPAAARPARPGGGLGGAAPRAGGGIGGAAPRPGAARPGAAAPGARPGAAAPGARPGAAAPGARPGAAPAARPGAAAPAARPAAAAAPAARPAAAAPAARPAAAAPAARPSAAAPAPAARPSAAAPASSATAARPAGLSPRAAAALGKAPGAPAAPASVRPAAPSEPPPPAPIEEEPQIDVGAEAELPPEPVVAHLPADAAPAYVEEAPAPSADPCPKCGAMVQQGFRFCGSCGHDMTVLAPLEEKVEEQVVVHDLPMTPVRLVLIRPDGSEGESVPVSNDFLIGRDTGGVFAGDSYLSPQHARVRRGETSYEIEDLNSLNGVYMRIDREVPTLLRDGSIFRIGQEILRFDAIDKARFGANGEELMGSPNPGYLGRISLVIGRDTQGNGYPVPPEGMHLGRERGDVIFPDDGYVSGLHCRIHQGEDGHVYLTDVGSSNGTYVRITKPTPLRMGARMLLGQQLFRIEAG